ncbi:diguanylate cyclase [Oceanobacillus arenosus]|uniref:Diguanylate cyclase n=1 Tax=Oceanobacillus arenosus TaxID=1229153 RepID=A0A3D8PZA1_9BACI|nr:EAL domain-containing protein [Oceanobacillus arenosus]RDW21354.1 diguanylate cyclase [Oceanobacillus arenosus]
MLANFNKKKKLQAYLEQEMHSYQEIFENSPDILLFVVDLKGVIVNVHGGIIRLLGVDVDEIVGKKYRSYIYKEDVKIVKDYFTKVWNGETLYVKYRVTNKIGDIIPIDVTLTPIQLEDREVIGFYGLTHDISTERHLKQENLKLQERLKSIIHHAHEIIGILDSEGKFIFESPSIESSLGYKVAEITGQKSFDFVHPDDLPTVMRKFDEILNRPNTPFTIELRLRHKIGEWRDFTVVCTNLLENPNVNGIVCNLQDITEIKRQALEIQYMAYHDYLTKLPNRRAFEDRLDLESRLANVDGRKFAVLIFNLDGFKFLNDTFGHDIGDLLLMEVARKVNSALHNDIEMMARIGGDEFAILMTNLHAIDHIEKIAKAVLHVFEKSFKVKDYQLYLTASIGISIYPESGEDAASLMKNAGVAVYLAEKAGHNTYEIISPTANVETYKLFSLRNELRHAFHNDQFLVYYQPIMHAETNEIDAVEALVRWNHPIWGIVLPNEFIPLAEESGLIIEIGEWVLKTACKKLRSWHDAGYMVKASVNLSLIQFSQIDLIDIITSTLQENDLDPKWLTLEITETAMLEQKEKVLKKIAQIRALGIQISLDDFGAGFASFKNLKDIKPDILKIDKSLVKDIPSEQDSTEIVASIIQLAHRLSIQVVAEGIETKEQKELLLKLECERMQGYLFSKPVSEENIEKVLERTINTEIDPLPFQEQRAYFRLDLQYPLEALMTISELNGKKVQLGYTKVLFENLGPGGLRFLSNIKLPVSSDILIKFQTTLTDEDLTFYGTIVHESELDGLNRYGVEFIMDEQERGNLITKFNQLQVQLKKSPLLPGSPFVTEDVFTYFKQL